MTPGPLILGAAGRVGEMFRQLAAAGNWPGPAPVWLARRPLPEGGPLWDMEHAPPPDLPPHAGIILLAGVTSGSPAELARNSAIALAAVRLAAQGGRGPLLIASTAAVYGRAAGPQREDAPCRPLAPYGAAKLAMEKAVAAQVAMLDADAPRTCCLRIGNVAGADALFGAMARGPVTLDRLADGQGPRRAWIGPATLARVLVALLVCRDLPGVLNIAAPGSVGMAAICAAAGVEWHWRDAPPDALAALDLDTEALAARVALPPVTPDALLAEARAAGWKAAS